MARVQIIATPDTPQTAAPQKGRQGLARLINATRYSAAGLRAAFRHEAAFREEVVLACVLVPIALATPVANSSKALLIGSVLLVLVVELLNSAIEAVVDRISTEQHPLSKRAKDIGSAAVMLALVNAAAVWLLVLWPAS